jgi:NAD(P)H-flavin reductase
MSIPREAIVLDRTQETPGIFTLRLALADRAAQARYRFAPGQFNMLHAFGVGAAPISIMSDPDDHAAIGHTIRIQGRVTTALAALRPGDRLGLRGPFGRGWPMAGLAGRDVLVVTGGLGCAPVVSVIHYLMRRRAAIGRLVIIQGVKHADDLLWRAQYEAWAAVPGTQVLLAASVGGAAWPWHVGPVTDLIDAAQFAPDDALAMMCGPEGMMQAAANRLLQRGVSAPRLFLSMERNMQCAEGRCGHCQLGNWFVCRDGPVFAWPAVAAWLAQRGF